jgi:hypothetical protein
VSDIPENTPATQVTDYATLQDILSAVVALGSTDIRTLEDLRKCLNRDLDKNIFWLANQTEVNDALLTALLLAEFYDDTGTKGKRRLRIYWRGLKTLPGEVRAGWAEIVREWNADKRRSLGVGLQHAKGIAHQVAARQQRIWYNWRHHWFDVVLVLLLVLIVSLAFRAQLINQRTIPYVTVRRDAGIAAFEELSGHVELKKVPYKDGAFTALGDVAGRYALVSLPPGAMLSKDQVLSPELSGKMPSRRIVSVPIKTGTFSSTMKTPGEALMTLSARQEDGKESVAVKESASFDVIVLRLDQGGATTSAVLAIPKDEFDKASRLLGSHEVFLAQIVK